MVKTEKIPTYSLKKLRKQVKKTKETLALLEAELKKRQLEQQHDEIEHLEDYMEQANSSILSLGSILSMLKNDNKKS